MANLDAPHFTDPEAAREYLESIRWPRGAFCPHCGAGDRVYRIKGKSARPGLWKCGDCKKQFTVTVGTLFERSKIPLHKWLLAAYLLCSSKKGISTHQLHRMLGVTYKSAWFMSHRIREAMRDGNPPLIGGPGTTVEADETYWGNRPRHRLPRHLRAGGPHHQEKIFSLVERGGQVRSTHVARVTSATLKPLIRKQVADDTAFVTDDAGVYRRVFKHRDFSHETVGHRIGEYVRGSVHTNTIENYFSILKRGMTGVYQHCGSAHLKRYVGEFDFRYNHRHLSDAERADEALRGIEGKRMTYQQPRTRL